MSIIKALEGSNDHPNNKVALTDTSRPEMSTWASNRVVLAVPGG